MYYPTLKRGFYGSYLWKLHNEQKAATNIMQLVLSDRETPERLSINGH